MYLIGIRLIRLRFIIVMIAGRSSIRGCVGRGVRVFLHLGAGSLEQILTDIAGFIL